MKQRIFALLLALALLSGCGQQTPPPAETPAPATAPPTAVPAAATAAPSPVPTGPEESFPYDYEEVLADTEDFFLAVTALGIDRDGNWVVHLRIENRAEEIMSYRFLWQSINGLAIDDVLTYRVAVGGTLEPSFRILRDEMAAWGFEKPVQWSFTLKVSSAEADREPCFFEELSASPFGESSAVRYEFIPGPLDIVAMDNELAAVYITGWEPEDGGLAIEYVAVSRCQRPLLLVLPEGVVTLDGREYPVELSDGFGAFATLMGYLPVEGFSGGRPEHLALRLALADPAEWGDPLIDGTETDLSF